MARNRIVRPGWMMRRVPLLGATAVCHCWLVQQCDCGLIFYVEQGSTAAPAVWHSHKKPHHPLTIPVHSLKAG